MVWLNDTFKVSCLVHWYNWTAKQKDLHSWLSGHSDIENMKRKKNEVERNESYEQMLGLQNKFTVGGGWVGGGSVTQLDEPVLLQQHCINWPLTRRQVAALTETSKVNNTLWIQTHGSWFSLHSPIALYCWFRKQNGKKLPFHRGGSWTAQRPFEGGMFVCGCWLAKFVCQSEDDER